ncbi:protein-L-isoaspartate O-methyltransferase [Amylibacter marinus]|uniref:Protein-L-isoaspartate O-methyltransferase n=1 Tax=Amylibacter marinus TaxID=1475483 RepID=A0ABQ5VRU9_9RHOB|nr:protein-L-isoaspartate O-methyltransferase [Amylibacter marinus]GLQ33874.1 protein-L-isoaspartate O-methyltransferase [Amylibacter marinus]
MNDFTSARTAMVDCQVRPSDVTKYPIINALLNIAREKYVPTDKISIAYVGDHVALGNSRYLLDARTFAKMLDAVNVRGDELVLDIACGLGYSTAVIADLAEAVVGVEDNAELADAASETLSQQGVDNAIVVSAPLSTGAAKHGPYDVVVLQGAIEVFPESLVQQLKDGGRVAAIFVDGAMGQCRIGIKSGDTINWKRDFDATAPILGGFERTIEFNLA